MHITSSGENLRHGPPGRWNRAGSFRATRRIFEAAGAPIEWEIAEAGAAVFRKGIASGAPRETLDSIRNGLALKGPLETPVGYGNKSANVTLRKHFELYANIRPVRELPGIKTPFTGRGIDMVIVRENVEDVYAGIEHMQTADVAQCLKLMTRPGCERSSGRLRPRSGRGPEKARLRDQGEHHEAHRGHDEARLRAGRPGISSIAQDHIIIDNCAHQLVIAPEQFDVIVTSNMNGDIIPISPGLVGGLGIAPSSNLGDHAAIFEAVHGSAPTSRGQGPRQPDCADPSAAS